MGEVDVLQPVQVLVPAIKSVDQQGVGVIKTDPVHLQSIWRARSGRYLNLRLRVMTGEAKDGKRIARCSAVSVTPSSP